MGDDEPGVRVADKGRGAGGLLLGRKLLPLQTTTGKGATLVRRWLPGGLSSAACACQGRQDESGPDQRGGRQSQLLSAITLARQGQGVCVECGEWGHHRAEEGRCE